MYSTISKPQEGSTCKDSLPKCFMTTNPTAKLLRGAVNRGEVLRKCFHLNFIILQDRLQDMLQYNVSLDSLP